MGSDVLATGGPAPRIGRLGRLADGFAWPLSTSHYLELLNPLWARHAAKARVEAVRDETRDARTLTLRPGRSWRPHRAGQHVRIGVPVDGAREVRTYSISSEPERWQRDGCIEITVKAVAGGRVSPRLVRDTEPGSFVDLGAPRATSCCPIVRLPSCSSPREAASRRSARCCGAWQRAEPCRTSRTCTMRRTAAT